MSMETTTSTMAGSTSIESRPLDNGVTRRGHLSAKDPPSSTSTPSHTIANGSTGGPAEISADAADELRRAFRNKYRHVQAVHSQSKPSCLSHDTTETPSFLGFRNLMVIVLGRALVYRLFIDHHADTNCSGCQSPPGHRKHPKGWPVLPTPPGRDDE